MELDKYISLIYKNLKKEISASELEVLEDWAKDKKNEKFKNQIENDWELSEEIKPAFEIDTKADFTKFKTRMNEHKAQQTKVVSLKKFNYRRLFSIAAVVTLLGIFFWWNFANQSTVSQILVSTLNDETKEIELPDGSILILNKNSQLKYPESFAENNRTVSLNGEAFFKVQSNKEKPFTIELKNSKITVLGTQFNLRAFDKDTVFSVQVTEGTVQMSSTISEKTAIITKDKIGFLNLQENEISVKSAVNKNSMAWENQVFVYKKALLKTVINDLEQTFGVNIVIKNTATQNCEVSGRFTKATVDNVLDNLSNLYQLKIKKIDSKNYEILNGICD